MIRRPRYSSLGVGQTAGTRGPARNRYQTYSGLGGATQSGYEGPQAAPPPNPPGGPPPTPPGVPEPPPPPEPTPTNPPPTPADDQKKREDDLKLNPPGTFDPFGNKGRNYGSPYNYGLSWFPNGPGANQTRAALGLQDAGAAEGTTSAGLNANTQGLDTMTYAQGVNQLSPEQFDTYSRMFPDKSDPNVWWGNVQRNLRGAQTRPTPRPAGPLERPASQVPIFQPNARNY